MTFWQKSSEKCELLGLSVVLGEFSCGHCNVTCYVGKRNVFEQFLCKIEILSKQIFLQNTNKSTICTLINLLSWITVKRVYMAHWGQ